jgi:hypothetical protein
MRHICAKKLYDQGCVGFKTDSDGVKYPAWFDGPMCRNYNSLEDLLGSNTFSGTHDCTCVNSMSGYSLNNKPLLSTDPKGENPYNLTSTDTNYYQNGAGTPYSLNVWGDYSVDNINYRNGNPGEDDLHCTDSIKKHYGAYLLPKYYITNPGVTCTNKIVLNKVTAQEISMLGITMTNNCGRDAISRSASTQPTPTTSTPTSTQPTTSTPTPTTSTPTSTQPTPTTSTPTSTQPTPTTSTPTSTQPTPTTSTPPSTPSTPPTPSVDINLFKSNMILYIGIFIILLILMVVVFMVMKKK